MKRKRLTAHRIHIKQSQGLELTILTCRKKSVKFCSEYFAFEEVQLTMEPKRTRENVDQIQASWFALHLDSNAEARLTVVHASLSGESGSINGKMIANSRNNHTAFAR